MTEWVNQLVILDEIGRVIEKTPQTIINIENT